jgi:hypothetical protein
MRRCYLVCYAVRGSVRRSCPFGCEDWQRRMAKLLSLEATLHPQGRPRKNVNAMGGT